MAALPQRFSMGKADTDAGRKGGLAFGLVASWVAQILQIASGFIIPRMIDSGAGPVTLGVWDFGWSLVSYFSLIEGGVGSSVNRYIALERGKGDLDGVNRIASSAAAIQRAVGTVILILTVVFAFGIPYDLKGASPAVMQDARWLVFLLGAASGLTMFGAVYTGVLTGCHRWASHYLVYAVTNILSVIAMFTVLSLGYGIVALGVVQLVREILGRLIRRVLAYRACPGLTISMRLADRATIRSMIGFGGRMAIGRVSRLVLAQTTSMLIMFYMGPASLALFTRPRSLVRQASVFPQKHANMLVPTVASMFGANQTEAVKDFVISSCRSGVYMALPIMLFLFVNGTPLMGLWMGADYADPYLIGLLTLGFAAEVCYQPLESLLLGLNCHGKPGVAMMVAAVVGVSTVWLLLHFGFGLKSVAAAIGIPWTLVHGVYLPLYTCRRLAIPLTQFVREVWLRPLAVGIPFALILYGGRLWFPNDPLHAILAGMIAGGLFIGISYWIWVIPDDLKNRMMRRLLPKRLKPVTATGNPPENP
jgi:O-antigen/teichoic acid export membrane protein